MSTVKREWLLHGCMDLSGDDEADRVSIKTRALISEMYGGVEFSIKGWPEQGFRNTLWWYEKSVETPSTVASYSLKLDKWRGPNLYAGITVEKGYEDDEKAKNQAERSTSRTIESLLLDENWDWNRFVSSLNQIEPLVLSAAETLRSELYFCLEFGDNRNDSDYYVVRNANLYRRVGFKSYGFEDIFNFVTKSRRQLWGNVHLMRAFSLDECTPDLNVEKLIDVYRAMRPIRDLWRGVKPQGAIEEQERDS